MPELRVVRTDGGTGPSVPLDPAGGPLVLGRDLLPEDVELSRRHAELRPHEQGWTVFDLGSRNGTFIDGARVVRARLVDQSLLRVGRTLFLYLDGVDERAEALDGDLAAAAVEPGPVVILGEKGLGKRRVAEEIHRRSGRPGALAVVGPDGPWPLVAGPTTYLGAVDELTLDEQARLVSALLDTGTAGILAATSRDLRLQVAAGKFRTDLHALLGRLLIPILPLRRRREEIIPHALAWLARHHAPPLSVDATQALLLHDWPGNFRELEGALDAAAAAARGAIDIPPDFLPAPVAARAGARAVVPR